MGDKLLWNKYENYIIAHYITSNEQKYRFRPAPGCNFIIFCNDSSPKSLICDAQKNQKSETTKQWKSKYKQQQQKEKDAKKIKLEAELDGFEFFGQSKNSTPNKPKTSTKLIDLKKRKLLNGSISNSKQSS